MQHLDDVPTQWHVGPSQWYGPGPVSEWNAVNLSVLLTLNVTATPLYYGNSGLKLVLNVPARAITAAATRARNSRMSDVRLWTVTAVGDYDGVLNPIQIDCYVSAGGYPMLFLEPQHPENLFFQIDTHYRRTLTALPEQICGYSGWADIDTWFERVSTVNDAMRADFITDSVTGYMEYAVNLMWCGYDLRRGPNGTPPDSPEDDGAVDYTSDPPENRFRPQRH